MTKISQSSQQSAGAPGYPERSGQTVEIIRELTAAEHDRGEVGLMFRVRFSDGLETDAFDDELMIGTCAVCNALIQTLAGGEDDGGIDCTDCGRLFCDNCYDCDAGDGCHCQLTGATDQ